MAKNDILEMEDSSPLLANPEALRARWERDGTLLFKNAISPEAIAKVRNEYLERLKLFGVVDAAEQESVWNGKDRLDGKLAKPISDDVWRTLVADPKLNNVVQTFLGEAPTWLPIVVHRTAPPTENGAQLNPFFARHQDGIYNFGIDFITCWVPLMDIDEEVGGLAVAPGTHKSSLYPPNVFADPNVRIGIPEGAIPDAEWRRPQYKVGDLLMFHSMGAHAGLPNTSNKFRLSMDIRFLPESAAPCVGRMVKWVNGAITVAANDGSSRNFVVSEHTIVRGPKGHPVYGEDQHGILFPDAEIIIMPDSTGQAKLIRSVSRKYIDLPATWYDSLPANWVK